ncbi:hypothetical protein C1I59_01095 [Paenibacillus polymyxa]|nr:hypothetical protein EGM68_01815 [Paenibacillus sp. M-152]TKH40100.1 hypothetical protein C1I59_01095 [Paenibacillus polymyxa]
MVKNVTFLIISIDDIRMRKDGKVVNEAPSRNRIFSSMKMMKKNRIKKRAGLPGQLVSISGKVGYSLPTI